MRPLSNLPLFARPVHTKDTDLHDGIASYLRYCPERGQTRKEIALAIGLPPNQATFRKIRIALEDSDEVISAPGKCFVHTSRATVEEHDEMGNAYISQGRKMMERGIRIKNIARKGAR